MEEAGNVLYPPAFSLELPSCVTVANLKWTVTPRGQQTLDLAQNSNYGVKTVQIGAPGTWIQSAIPRTGDEAPDYGEKSGTSMAAPHVAGKTWTLLNEAHGAPCSESVACRQQYTEKAFAPVSGHARPTILVRRLGWAEAPRAVLTLAAK